jgi:hypothetical protein
MKSYGFLDVELVNGTVVFGFFNKVQSLFQGKVIAVAEITESHSIR